MNKQIFISFEGIDGVGKTTQVNKVYKRYTDLGYSVVKTREPGGTELGKRIRKVVLSNDLHNISQQAETLMYAADRAQHVQEVIKPALAAGQVVLSDRYIDSSVAFQGYGLEHNTDLIKEVNRWAIAGLMPCITFCLDQDVKTALRRTKGDRIEQRALEYHCRVRAGYHQIAKDEPHRFVIIDATGSIEQVFSRIWEVIAGRNLL